METLSRINVLLIEDDEHDSSAIARALRTAAGMEFRLETYKRSEPVLQMESLQDSFDVALIDHRLPGVTGLEAGKRLQERNANVPLVLLTGAGSEELAVEAMRCGFADYLVKDVGGKYLDVLPSKLMAVVRNARLEIAYAENLKRYVRLVEKSPGIHYSFSPTRGGSFVSQRVEDILGYTVEDLQQDPFIWYNSIHPDDKPAVDQVIATLEEGEHYTIEYRIKTADDRWIWLRDTSLVIRSEQGGHVVEGMALDITKEKRLEEMRLNLQRMTHHDLRSPLSGNIGMATILAEELEGNWKHCAELIATNGYLILNLLDRTLDVCRLEENMYPTDLKPVRVDELVADAVTGLRAHPEFKGFPIRTDMRPVVAFGDKTLCWSVLTNLMTNALEADRGFAGVDISCQEAEGRARILIHNNQAVPEDIRPQFFEKYKTSGKSKGLGLGVYSARLMVEAMGGTIDMETSSDSGTTLQVTLPLADAPAQKP